MTRPREAWFRRHYGRHGYWVPIHRNGWRAIAFMVGGLSSVLVLAIVFSVIEADPLWTVALQVAAFVIGIVFLLIVRGRIRP